MQRLCIAVAGLALGAAAPSAELQKAIDMAKAAEKLAQEAQQAHSFIKDIAYKGAFAVPSALAAVDDARNAAQFTQRTEVQVRALLNKAKEETRLAAFSTAKKELQTLQSKARNVARLAAEKRMVQERAEEAKKVPEALKAATQPYEQAIKQRAAAEAAWIAKGNKLQKQAVVAIHQAQELQVEADGWAGAQTKQGNAQAYKLMLKSKRARADAQKYNAQAGDAFLNAQEIDESLPDISRQAAKAAYVAASKTDPSAQAPLPPLVLSQDA